MCTNHYIQFINKNKSFDEFLNFLLINLNNDLIKFNVMGSFIALLDEKKINNRFSILNSSGKFITKNSTRLITSQIIDMLSIVFIGKKNLLKDNIFIDVIGKEDKNIFIYIEFEDILNKEQKTTINMLFIHINELIKNTSWR